MSAPPLDTSRFVTRRLYDESVALWKWWTGEVRDAIEAVATFSERQAPRYMLVAERDRWVLRKKQSNEEETVIESEGTAIPSAPAVATGDAPATPLTIVLPQAAVLLLDLRLPPMPDRDIGNALELQLERELPLGRESLAVRWRVIHKLDSGAREIAVAAVRKQFIEQLLKDVAAAGWRVLALRSSADDRSAAFDFGASGSDRSHTHRYDSRLAALAIGFVSAWLLIVAGQWVYERQALDDQIVQARVQVEEFERASKALSGEGKPLHALEDLQAKVTAQEALAAISSAMPPNAWIYYFDFQPHDDEPASVKIAGYAPTATDLVDALQANGQLDEVTLVQAMAEEGAERERLEITTRLRIPTSAESAP